MLEPEIHFLDRYPRPRRKKAGGPPAAVIGIDADPALIERRRLRRTTAGAEPLRVLALQVSRAQDRQRPAPPPPAEVIPFVAPRRATRRTAPAGGAQVIPLSFISDDTAYAALCRQALGLTGCGAHDLHPPHQGPDDRGPPAA